MAIHKSLFASLLICLLFQISHGATKERLFSDLEKGALEVTAKPSRESGMYIFKRISIIRTSLRQIFGVQILDFAFSFQCFFFF